MPLANVRVYLGDLSDVPVARYEMREAIGELSEIALEVLLTDPELDMASVVGKVGLVLFLDQPVMTQMDGIIRRCRQLSSESTGVSRYEIVIASFLWLATLRTDHRIFQDLSVPEIVEAVLKGYKDRIPMPEKALTKVHDKREYTVQYGETDHDFICRILAEAGISSFFEPADMGTAPATRWILSDDTTVGPKKTTVAFNPPSMLKATEPHVLGLQVTADLTTSSVTARDYDYKKPDFVLSRTSQTSDPLFNDEGELEAYVFEIGKFTDEKGGDARTKQLLEEARSERRVLRLSTSFLLPAGAHFGVKDLPGHPVETELVVMRTRASCIAVDGQPEAPRLSYVLECVPAQHPFRPRRRSKPRIYGTHTAFVVGQQAGVDEIDVDEMGRVKVQYRWDRRDAYEGNLTRRIRVSQGWAGADFGFVLLPRVNEEVIISYLDGDPDEPIIVGRVHNTFVATPLKLPDEKTQSIWKSRSSPGGEGYNMILMEDKAGEERLDMRAQKDHHFEILHDSSRNIGNNETVNVKNAQSVTAGSHSTSAGTISFKAKTTIDEDAGTKMTLTAGSQIKAESVQVLINGKSITSVHGKSFLYLYGGITAYLNGGVTVEIGAGSSVTVKAPTIFVDGGTVFVTGGEVNIGNDKVNITGGPVSISGSTVDITGGTVNIKGGSVNLNC